MRIQVQDAVARAEGVGKERIRLEFYAIQTAGAWLQAAVAALMSLLEVRPWQRRRGFQSGRQGRGRSAELRALRGHTYAAVEAQVQRASCRSKCGARLPCTQQGAAPVELSPLPCRLRSWGKRGKRCARASCSLHGTSSVPATLAAGILPFGPAWTACKS